MTTDRKAVVIVGAGQAGGWVARTLREEAFRGRIILIGDESYPPYERPPLSKRMLSIDTAPEHAFLQPLHAYSEQDIELRTDATVVSVDLRRKAVSLNDSQELHFDTLVLTTGSSVRRLDVAGGEAAGIVYLRTMQDALNLRERLRRKPRTVIIGGGFIGLEVASSARALGCEVTVLETQDRLLSRAAPREIGEMLEGVLRDHGVVLRLSTQVRALSCDGEMPASITTQAGARMAADLVVAGIGINPSTMLAQAAGLQVEDGIVVDENGLTSHPDVYAAGDVTRHYNPLLGRHVRCESWQNAQNQAIVVGRNIAGIPSRHAEIPWFWSDMFDLNLQIAGLPLRSDCTVVRGDLSRRDGSLFLLAGKKIVGVYGVNRPRDVIVARKLVADEALIDVHRLADDQIPLKKVRG